MAGPRGYSSYRGRGSRGRTVLTVILVGIILAALAVIRLQSYVVYDETGRPRLELPWDTEEPVLPPEDEELNLTVEPSRSGELRAWQLDQRPLTGWKEALESAGAEDGAAVALTGKDAEGHVYFDAGTPAADFARRIEPGTAGELETLLESGRWTIVRLACFHDPLAANRDLERKGLKNTGGYIFYDGNNSQWMDPGKPAARAYLCDLAVELAELGVDEILLTDVSYPTVGKLDKIDYGEDAKTRNLETFLQEMRAALEPYGTTLSLEMTEEAVARGGDDYAGLRLAGVAPLVDRIYAATVPEQAEVLAAAVEAAGPDTDFVPELPAGTRLPEQGSFLLLTP